MRVRPTPLAAGASALPLTPEEQLVLARIEGRLSIEELGTLTGMDPQRLAAILKRLVAHGAVWVENDGTTPTSAVVPSSPAASPPSGVEAVADSGRPSDAAEVERDADAEAALDRAGEELAATEGGYRRHYEATFRGMGIDARVAAARTAGGADLSALAFDPEPRVVASLLENAHVTLEHVRLVAMHHRTATGLEILARRRDWLRDGLVERRLLRNPQAGDVVLGRVLVTKRLPVTYKIAIDRDIPDLTRAKARDTLRQKFQSATSEERADLVLRTDARCLTMMTGCTFDARTTAMLCGRQFYSVLFIQNVARFSAAPPALLAHLAKQPFVRKNPALRKMLLQHANMPGDVKRQP